MILQSTNIQFDKLAEEASSELFSNGVSLNQSVIKIAQREKLNPEEVKRLVEKTNLHATLTMLKAATDKKAEIFLANPEEVLTKTHFSTNKNNSVEKVACEFEGIPDLRGQARIKDIKLHPGMDKTAARLDTSSQVKDSFILVKKVEELSRQKIAEEIKVKDSLDFIISEFSKMRAPSFSKFAEEVYTIYGEPSVPILTKIASITKDKVSPILEKLGSVVDDSTTLLKKYAQVNTGIVNIIMLDSELTQTKQDITKFWAGIK